MFGSFDNVTFAKVLLQACMCTHTPTHTIAFLFSLTVTRIQGFFFPLLFQAAEVSIHEKGCGCYKIAVQHTHSYTHLSLLSARGQM